MRISGWFLRLVTSIDIYWVSVAFRGCRDKSPQFLVCSDCSRWGPGRWSCGCTTLGGAPCRRRVAGPRVVALDRSDRVAHCSLPPELIQNMTHSTGIRSWIKEHLFQTGHGSLLKKPKYRVEFQRTQILVLAACPRAFALRRERKLPDERQLVDEVSPVEGVCLQPPGFAVRDFEGLETPWRLEMACF